MERMILLLGDERLYQQARELSRGELPYIAKVVEDLHDTMMAFRKKYGVGRAIAAPQIGEGVRLIYMNLAGEKTVFINPTLHFPDGEMMEVLDDCMSFPGLYVKLKRYTRCEVRYRDMDWTQKSQQLEGDLSELIQHEYDHLDGILATMRAADPKALVMKNPLT